MAYIDTLRARFLADARTFVDLRAPSGTAQPGGFKKTDYPTSLTNGFVRALWENAHGSEAIAATGLQYQEPATVTVRWVPDIKPNLRVLLRGDVNRPFEVIGVNDIENRHEYVELKVRRVVGA